MNSIRLLIQQQHPHILIFDESHNIPNRVIYSYAPHILICSCASGRTSTNGYLCNLCLLFYQGKLQSLNCLEQPTQIVDLRFENHHKNISCNTNSLASQTTTKLFIYASGHQQKNRYFKGSNHFICQDCSVMLKTRC